MESLEKYCRLNRLLFLGVLFIAVSTALAVPQRLDLYDASDNNLMFVTFQYDAAGRNIGREVYMSDSTFIRRVVINYNASGQRTSEVSFNFNDDTSFVLAYQPGAEVTGFTLVDQFKMDWIGGGVTYSPVANPLVFDLSFKATGGLAARVTYEQDGGGNLTKVNVADQNGVTSYYGLFDNTPIGVKREEIVEKAQAPAIVQTRGGLIDVQLNLRKQGEVRCELMTLSGRHGATLLREKVGQGIVKRSFRLDGTTMRGVAVGVYVLMVSVDGVTVSRSRYLHQHRVGGGVQ